MLETFIGKFIDFPKILVAFVNGPAVGISVSTLALFDAVYASSSATFAVPFTRTAQSAEGCSSLTFPSLMGSLHAKEMLLFDRKLSAQQAEQRGLVTRVIDEQTFAAEMDKICQEILSLPKGSLLTSKSLLQRWNKDLLHQINGRSRNAETALADRRVRSSDDGIHSRTKEKQIMNVTALVFLRPSIVSFTSSSSRLSSSLLDRMSIVPVSSRAYLPAPSTSSSSEQRYYFGPSRLVSKRIQLKKSNASPNERLDFSITGGNGVEPIHVSSVVWASQAYLQGMRPADEIVSVNGITFDQHINYNKALQVGRAARSSQRRRVSAFDLQILHSSNELELIVRTLRVNSLDATLYNWIDPMEQRATSPPPSTYLSVDAQLPYPERTVSGRRASRHRRARVSSRRLGDLVRGQRQAPRPGHSRGRRVRPRRVRLGHRSRLAQRTERSPCRRSDPVGQRHRLPLGHAH
jgi:hypothetical protein